MSISFVQTGCPLSRQKADIDYFKTLKLGKYLTANNSENDKIIAGMASNKLPKDSKLYRARDDANLHHHRSSFWDYAEYNVRAFDSDLWTRASSISEADKKKNKKYHFQSKHFFAK